MADLSKYSTEELLALYGENKAAPPKKQTPAATAEEASFLDNLGSGVLSGAKRRALGLLQLALEGAGQTDSDIYKDTEMLADQYLRETKGTGVGGTIGEIAGDPLTAATLPIGGSGGGLLQLAKMGFGLGAAEGFTRPTSEGESRALNTGVSALTGTVAAPVIGYVGGKAGEILDYGANKATDAVKFISRKMGSMPTDDIIGLEVAAGSSYDDLARAVEGMSDDAVALFKQGVNAGLSPRQSYLAAKAKDKGISLTKGMLTQDPAAQRLEDYAAQGVLNQNASKVATATGESNKAAARGWADQLLADVSGSADALTDETSVADSVARAVKSRAADLKGPASAAYKVGAQSKARVATENLSDFPTTIKSELRTDGVDFNASPTFKRDLKMMERLTRKSGDDFSIKSIKWPALDKLKQNISSKARFDVNLNQVSDYAQRQEILAYRKTASALNGKLDDIITNNLLENPDEAAAALRKAPALWKEYRQTIYGNDGKSALGKIVDYDMTDRQVADLFGSSLAGRGDTQKVVAQLKNALGDNSAEFGQVRGMFMNRLFKGALTEGDDIGGKTFGTALNTQWRQFKTKNKALMDELFTPDMQREIQDFVSTSYLMSARNASKTNPSGSGITMMDGVINLFQRMGASGTMLGDLAQAGGKAALLRGNSKQAIQSIAEPLKNMGSKSRIISDALKATGAAAGIQSNRIVSDAIPPGATPSPALPSDNPLQGMSDEELLRMYQESAPESLPKASQSESSALPEDIRRDEGLRHAAYEDTTGHKTVGFGFNMDSGIARRVWKKAGISVPFDDVYTGKAAINDAHAEALGRESFSIALDDATSLYENFARLSPERKEALLNLSYQLGKPKLAGLESFNAAVRKGAWAEAVRQLLKTKYALQTPDRAREIARKLLRGKA